MPGRIGAEAKVMRGSKRNLLLNEIKGKGFTICLFYEGNLCVLLFIGTVFIAVITVMYNLMFVYKVVTKEISCQII